MATSKQPTARVPVAATFSNVHGCALVVCDDGAAFLLKKADPENPDGWVQIDPLPGTAHDRAREAVEE